jgi:hypothetical protein
MDSSKFANILLTIHIMKVAGWSPMHVHDVVDKPAVYNLQHETTKFIAECLHEESSGAPPTSQMWAVNIECA